MFALPLYNNLLLPFLLGELKLIEPEAVSSKPPRGVPARPVRLNWKPALILNERDIIKRIIKSDDILFVFFQLFNSITQFYNIEFD